MNYHVIYRNDMVNGAGVRTTLFVSGCDHMCKGCYNQNTWSPSSGKPFGQKQVEEILSATDFYHVRGLSLTGGDPLFKGNLLDILDLIEQFRSKFGQTKSIWMWTGYTMKELKEGEGLDWEIRRRIIKQIDVLVDGKFEEDKMDKSLSYCGSTNQNIIYLNKA